VVLLTITVLTFFCFVDIGGIVDHTTNNNKKKESINSDGQQYNKYQQNKRKSKQ
jgi:hypothetical protein